MAKKPMQLSSSLAGPFRSFRESPLNWTIGMLPVWPVILPSRFQVFAKAMNLKNHLGPKPSAGTRSFL